MDRIKSLYRFSFFDYLLLSIRPFAIVIFFLLLLFFLLQQGQGLEIFRITAEGFIDKKAGHYLLKYGAFVYFFSFVTSSTLVNCELLRKTPDEILRIYPEHELVKIWGFTKNAILCLSLSPIIFFSIILLFHTQTLGLGIIIIFPLLLLFIFLRDHLNSKKIKTTSTLELQQKYLEKIREHKPKIDKLNKEIETEQSKLLPQSTLFDRFWPRKKDQTKLSAEQKEQIALKIEQVSKTLFKAKKEVEQARHNLLTHIDPRVYKMSIKNKTLFFIGLGILLVFVLYPQTPLLLSFFGPASMLVLGFIFVTNIFISIYAISKKNKFPFIPLIVVYVFLCTLWNNNHDIRTVKNSQETLYTQPSFQDHFSKWVKSKFDSTSLQTNYIYIVSAEGGGIRSAYWTAQVLNKFQEEFGLYNKTYAVSGVSGGSVGLAVYSTYFCNQEMNKLKPDNLSTSLGGDFVSPLISGWFFPEILQKFLPFPLRYLDRTRRLEDSFSDSFSNSCQSNDLDKGVVSYWNNENQHLPAIFFNCTKVEDGRKAIVSNLCLDSATFYSYDLINIVNKDIPIKTAALMSARFPYVTPAAKIENGKYWGNIVDGGYFDNSGLHTVFQIVKAINIHPETKKYHIKPVLIYLKNSNDEVGANSAFLLESKTPLRAFLNSWDARSDYYIPDLISQKKAYNFELLTFALEYSLNGKNIKHPLAWSLSKKARGRIDAVVERLGIKSKSENYASYVSLKDKVEQGRD